MKQDMDLNGVGTAMPDNERSCLTQTFGLQLSTRPGGTMLHSRTKCSYFHPWPSKKRRENALVSFIILENQIRTTSNMPSLLCTELSQHRVCIPSQSSWDVLGDYTMALFFQHSYNLLLWNRNADMNPAQKTHYFWEPNIEGEWGLIGTKALQKWYKLCVIAFLAPLPSLTSQTIAELEQCQRGTENERYRLLRMIEEETKKRTMAPEGLMKK